ncbi:MAG TPA: 4'-phosphopantetheinyl transferase superfamily protein [Ktedonobacteraceae bacterium]|nr:4'-phosphopantetheinyl transferase superfamily protein [Ktedonobacteraceae bacterium]
MGLRIFFCYAQKDEKLFLELRKHFTGLQREGLIELWHDQDISAGKEWEPETISQLNSAHIILLLISSDFMSSDYCSDKIMKHALERHERGEARVIPVLLRPVHWPHGPLSRLCTLPASGKAVTTWLHKDQAFVNIAEGIVKVIEEIAPHLIQELHRNIANIYKGKVSLQSSLENKRQLRRLLSRTEQWNVPGDHMELTDQEVHVWKISLQQSPDDINLLKHLLTPEEIAHAERWSFEEDQNRFIVSRGTLRRLLGFYLDIDPSQVRLAITPYGKPILDSSQHNQMVHFSDSHAKELIIYAFTRKRLIGVDIEFMHKDFDYEAIAQHHFSQYESATLHGLPDEAKPQGFFNGWTRKEAYTKATGRGVSLIWSTFDVSLRPGEPATLFGNRENSQELMRWSLRELAPDSGYVGALAVEGEGWNLQLWH